MIPSQSKPPPPPPINTPCVNTGNFPGQNQNDLDQLEFTFGKEDEQFDDDDDDDEAHHNKSNLSRS